MKKFARTICVLMLSVVLGVSCFALTACPEPEPPVTGGNVANETRPLVFSVQELDNVFNPFFSTSGYDTEITGNTQVSMLTTTSKGEAYCGPDEPTVALNYSQTIYYDDDGDGVPTEYKNGAAPDLGSKKPEQIDPEDYYTTYRFLIKNNIKFSDGEPLTIKDVIFNLYTYLDPTYYGSSTIYSTAIKGLQNYRMQEEEVDEDSSGSFNETMIKLANERIGRIRSAYLPSTLDTTNAKEAYRNRLSESQKQLILNDVETVRFLFWSEIVSDYSSAESELSAYQEENEKNGVEAHELGFTEVWEIFLFNEGFISVEWNSDGTIATYDSDAEAEAAYDKNGNLRKAGDKKINYADTWKWWHDKDSLIAIAYNELAGIYNNEQERGNYIEADGTAIEENGVKRPATAADGPKTDIITNEFGDAVGSEYKNSATDATYWDRLWTSNKLASNLYSIVSYWRTAQSVLDQFIAEEKQNWFATDVDGQLKVPTIEGITVEKLTAGDTFSGQFGNNTITEDQYVLNIEIEKVDPKAIWNFGFTIAPMHYYSNADNDTTGEFNSTHDYRSFNYPGIDGYDSSKPISVGRPFGSKDYLDEVLKAANIISVPVGAGMYKVASYDMHDENYAPAQRPKFTEFLSNNVVYYIRNPYFYTTSGEGKSAEESAICNCKIKYIRYKVITNARLLDSVLSGEIDYGDPGATEGNINALEAAEGVAYKTVDNNGYGYIGVNAKYVPDLEIRQAIMHTMNTDLIKTYYLQGFSSLIYRPVSTVSWASPQNKNNIKYNTLDKYKNPYYKYYSNEEEMASVIEGLRTEADYTSRDSDGVYYRMLTDGTKHRLEYTFTIAGASDDHPAYSTLSNSAEILNKNGFKITVKTDANALSKLSEGTLTVWAAAWSSATDPDMYQVYHMDSTATSVKSWGYPTIIAGNQTDKATYGEQYIILEELAVLIEQARSVLDTETRTDWYVQAYDKIMELAVELPTYQRVNMYAYRSTIIDDTTFNQNYSAYSGLLARMWEVELQPTAV